MQVTCKAAIDIRSIQDNSKAKKTYLQALLASLDSGDIASNTTSNDDKILVLCESVNKGDSLFRR